ncbi:hypothetical protein ACJD0Z_18650 [Flavobacteriaceae bacterium M23B6Z8]
MKEEEIKSYLDRLNYDNFEETIFLRPLNKYVDLARLWNNEPKLEDPFEHAVPSYKFFFIKNENEKFVGAVLDMERNLHWYILEEERKKGYLTKSLKETILPYLFYIREKQRITIESSSGELNYMNSRKVAESVGFVPTNETETEFELDKKAFDWSNENLNEQNGTISKSRLEELRKRIVLSSKELLRVSDELLMTYDDDKQLRELAKRVASFYYAMGHIKQKGNQS